MTIRGPRPLAFWAPRQNRPRAGRRRVSKACRRGFDSFTACTPPELERSSIGFVNRRSGFDSLQGLWNLKQFVL